MTFNLSDDWLFNEISKKRVFGFILKIVAIAVSISVLVIFFHFKPNGSLSISVDSVVNKEKNLFYVDLSDNPAFTFFVKPNPRMYVSLNGRTLYDRVQLIGQGMVKPELKEMATNDYISSPRPIFLLEGYDLYFTHIEIKNKNDIKSLKATQVKILNPLLFFWFPLLILAFFFIHFFCKIPFSIRRMALIMFLLAMSCMISMTDIHFKWRDFESMSLVNDFLKPAYNLTHHGSYTIRDISNDNQKKVRYANKREPLFSFLMVPFIYFDRSYAASNSYAQYSLSHYKRNFPGFLLLQLFIIIAIGTISGYFVYQITGSLLFALLTNMLVSSSPTLTTAALGIRDTNLIALCLLWFSVSSYWYFKNKSLFNMLSVSLAASCLILSRASFLYIFPFIYLFLIIIEFMWVKKLNLKKSSIYNILFLLLVLTLVGSWCLRNHVKTGNFSINTYGYGLANVRLCYNDMTHPELFQSFVAWAPEMTEARWKEIAGSESRFHRNSKNSFRKCQLNCTSKHSSLSAAMLSVVQNLLKHTLTTISSFYKGLFPEAWRGRKDRPFLYRSILSGLLHMAMFFSLIYFSLKSLPCFAFSFPTFSFMLFNAFCTNNIQRYNFPVLPVFYVCGGIILFWVVQSRFQHLRKRVKK